MATLCPLDCSPTAASMTKRSAPPMPRSGWTKTMLFLPAAAAITAGVCSVSEMELFQKTADVVSSCAVSWWFVGLVKQLACNLRQPSASSIQIGLADPSFARLLRPPTSSHLVLVLCTIILLNCYINPVYQRKCESFAPFAAVKPTISSRGSCCSLFSTLHDGHS